MCVSLRKDNENWNNGLFLHDDDYDDDDDDDDDDEVRYSKPFDFFPFLVYFVPHPFENTNRKASIFFLFLSFWVRERGFILLPHLLLLMMNACNMQ